MRRGRDSNPRGFRLPLFESGTINHSDTSPHRSLNFRSPVKRFHYAWIVVIVTFLALLAAQAVRAAPGVIITSLESEFGWSRTAISFAISLSIFTFGLGGPLGGTIIDRYGLRLVMLVGDLLIVGGLVGLIFVRDLWQMYVLWGLPIGIGTGMVGGVLGGREVPGGLCGSCHDGNRQWGDCGLSDGRWFSHHDLHLRESRSRRPATRELVAGRETVLHQPRGRAGGLCDSIASRSGSPAPAAGRDPGPPTT